MTAMKHEAIIPIRAAWLAQRREAPLRPEVPIVDAHHHLWTRGGEPYLLAQFLDDAESGHRIVASVYMECESHYRPDGPEHLRPVGEVDYAAGVAAEAGRKGGGTRVCSGVIGHADLRMGDRVEAVVDAMEEAGQGRLRGIRQIAAWHPDRAVKGTVANPPPGLLMDADFRRGLKVLATKRLCFDSWALHTQLLEFYDLACAFPEVPMVMNHTGGAINMGLYAGRRDIAFAEWRLAIRTLAKAENACAKIGGFGMRLWGFGFDQRPLPPSSEELATEVRPYVEACIEAFGPGRCMFESNFPVDKGSYSYVVLWNAYKRIVEKYSPDDDRICCSGARRSASTGCWIEPPRPRMRPVASGALARSQSRSRAFRQPSGLAFGLDRSRS